MIKAVLCDRDGVLLDSEIVNIRSSIQALHALAVVTDAADDEIIMGKHPLDYVDDFVKKYDIDGERFLSLRARFYDDLLQHVHVFQDTVDFIMHIKRTYALPTALATSANAATTVKILGQHHLDDLFDAMVTFDDCTKRKPNPQPYLIAARKLHVAPQACLVIEDSPVGVRAAKTADMTCVVRINDKNKNLDFHEADLVVHNLHDAEDFFRALCKE